MTITGQGIWDDLIAECNAIWGEGNYDLRYDLRPASPMTANTVLLTVAAYGTDRSTEDLSGLETDVSTDDLHVSAKTIFPQECGTAKSWTVDHNPLMSIHFTKEHTDNG